MMLHPERQNDDTTITFPDDEGQLSVSAWITEDGADDTPEWARDARHVQIDTDDGTSRGLVVHLNDTTIYQGNPEAHENAAEVLRQVRAMMARESYEDAPYRLLGDIDSLITRSGVIL